jgi:hypothetical protein
MLRGEFPALGTAAKHHIHPVWRHTLDFR